MNKKIFSIRLRHVVSITFSPDNHVHLKKGKKRDTEDDGGWLWHWWQQACMSGGKGGDGCMQTEEWGKKGEWLMGMCQPSSSG